MQRIIQKVLVAALVVGLLGFWASRDRWQRLEVTATAYNSLPEQTTATDPDIAAWGDRLAPGMQALAVSRDLLEMGLGYRSRVRIEGLEGEWIVLDKMNKRMKNKIDIYMGTDVAAARKWGRRDVTIHWKPARGQD